VCHALTDALLGAAAVGDIGHYFPDSDPRWRGASSLELLRQVAALLRARRLVVANADVVVVMETPKIAPFIGAMRERLAAALGIDPASVSVKGKTNEGVDAVGRGEAVAVHAVVMIKGLD